MSGVSLFQVYICKLFFTSDIAHATCRHCHNVGEKGVHVAVTSSSSDKIFGKTVDEAEATPEFKWKP